MKSVVRVGNARVVVCWPLVTMVVVFGIPVDRMVVCCGTLVMTTTETSVVEVTLILEYEHCIRLIDI